MNLRKLETTDYPRLAELLSHIDPEPTTVAQLEEWDAAANPQQLRRRTVMVDMNNYIIGSLDVGRNPWGHEGRFWLEVIIDPAYRQQGIGSTLYEEGLRHVRELGAKEAATPVRDNDTASLQFALKRGYQHNRHAFESVLDLRTFNETAFQGIVQRCEAAGFRFASLKDLDETWRKQLYQVNRTAGLDVPGSNEFWDYEQFTRNVFNASWFNPDGQILAIEGDKAVGLGAVGYFADTNSSYSAFSGVLPEYRGRGLAQALKLMTVRKAIEWGADYIRTHNDSTNTPMLKINRKFGYQPEPGIYYLLRSLEQAV